MKKFLAALLISMLLSTGAQAGTVETSGRGSDQQSAIRAALRQAIEQEIGAVVDSQTRIKNHQLIEEEIRLKSAGFIEGYEIVSINQTGGIFEATVRTNVRSKELRAELMTLLEKKAIVETAMEDPRIKIIAVDERGIQLPDVEDEFMKALKNQGFSRMISDADDADYIARVLVSDKTISARLMGAASGEIICVETFEIQKRMFTDTRQWSINNAAQRLARAALNHAAQLEQHITVELETPSIEPTTFLNRLKALEGVSGVFRRSLNEFDVNFDGAASSLAALLEREGFSIRELSATVIKI